MKTAAPARSRAWIALALLVPFPVLGVTLAMWVAPGTVGKTVYLFCKVWILALPLLWRLVVERQPLSLSPARDGGLGLGATLGAAIGGGVVGAYGLLLHGTVDPAPLRELAVQNGFDRAAVYLAFGAYLMLVNALLEEYVWRWFVLTRWEALVPPRSAVLLAALCFTLHHILALKSYLPWGPTLLASSGVFVGGWLWGWMYRRYRSIWPGYVSHVLVDAAVLAVGWLLLF